MRETLDIKVPGLRFPEFSGEWELGRLGDRMDYTNGKAHESFVADQGQFELINSRFISTEGRIKKTVSKCLTPAEIGDITFVLSDLPNGRALAKAFYVESKNRYAVNQRICRLRALKSEQTSSKFFYFLSNRNRYFLRFDDRLTQTHLSKSDVLQFSFYIPSLAEQQKIAEFLTAVDGKIGKLKRKKELLEAYKKGAMQKLFSQEIRFKDDQGNPYPDWGLVKVDEIIEVVNIKSTENNQYPVLTSSRRGLYFQNDYYNKQVASEDNTGYNVVPRGCFTYRHMSDDLAFKFNLNTICDYGLVSTLYPVFRTREHTNSYFLKLKLNEGEEFKRFSIQLKQGGSRTYMYLSKLKGLKLLMPSKVEQQKIAEFLTGIDDKIEAVANQIEQAAQFKKGLLQKMFV